MICYLCGSDMHNIVTDLPFKVNEKSIVVIKDLPVIQCGNCHEYLLDDTVMEGVDKILSMVDVKTELEIIRYAA